MYHIRATFRTKRPQVHVFSNVEILQPWGIIVLSSHLNWQRRISQTASVCSQCPRYTAGFIRSIPLRKSPYVMLTERYGCRKDTAASYRSYSSYLEYSHRTRRPHMQVPSSPTPTWTGSLTVTSERLRQIDGSWTRGAAPDLAPSRGDSFSWPLIRHDIISEPGACEISGTSMIGGFAKA